MRTQVATIGAGPSGLLLAHLLRRHGIDSIVLESRSQAHVLGRIRAGILEDSSVRLLSEVGLGARIAAEGMRHRGIYLQRPGHRDHIDFVDLIDRSVWVYGQTELTKDLVSAAADAAQPVQYEISDTTLLDLDHDRPLVAFRDADGSPQQITADVVVGCDGSFGPSRSAIPSSQRQVWQMDYPYAWLGVLADVAPSTDELIYAWHPDGFALHSMRSASVSRFYLQVPAGEQVTNWSDDRIWAALSQRLGEGQSGWTLRTSTITEKSVLPMRSFVLNPMRFGRLFLAGDAAHIVPPTGAKGLNLAIADVALLAPALAEWLGHDDPRLAEAYSAAALHRVWRSTHFSWWMTTMLHREEDPFRSELQLAQLRGLATSRHAAAALAENYTGFSAAS